MDSSGHWLFFIALTGAATTSLCFITPAVRRRLLFRTGLKEKIVHRANERWEGCPTWIHLRSACRDWCRRSWRRWPRGARA
ncbi:DUF6328 family protein [Nonomuraea sp. NPDC048881]|uniref:DUF6328 family protein n=1 Tax=Nonomuraea sp. NPDC048881 TaxID=3155030 RepID=UPI0033CA7A8F